MGERKRKDGSGFGMLALVVIVVIREREWWKACRHVWVLGEQQWSLMSSLSKEGGGVKLFGSSFKCVKKEQMNRIAM